MAKKKYSLDERVSHHNKKCDNLVKSTKNSAEIFNLFKRRDFAYSQGYVDGVGDSTQFSTVAQHNGNMKAYEAGVKQGQKHIRKINKLKF